MTSKDHRPIPFGSFAADLTFRRDGTNVPDMAETMQLPARERMGMTPAGIPVERFTLSNRGGLAVTILSLGGIVASLEAPDREGRAANVVLGLTTVADYLERSPHFGAITGRFANRIAGGRFTLDGTTYQLPCNDGPNTLHGGPHGFDKVVWTVAELTADR